MFKVVGIFAIFSAILQAQTADTSYFRAILLPGNEVPPVNSATRGTADIIISVVRDGSGEIVSGTVDFLVRVTFAAATTGIGLDLYSGPAGQRGTAVIGTGMSAGSPRPITNGGDLIRIPVQVTADNAAGLAALRGLLQDPTRHYINLLTSDLPNGAVRGQLQRAVGVVLLGLLHSNNITPAPVGGAYGVAQVVAIGTPDGTGTWSSGEVYLSATDNTSDPSAFTAIHIHQGAAGVTGPIGLTGTLPAGQTPLPSGAATLGPVNTEVTVTTATQLATFANLFTNPGSLYVDVHTTLNPNGIMRGQLRATDSMKFPIVLDSDHEVVKPRSSAMAPANITMYTLRNEDGSIAAGTFLSDVSYRLPRPTQVLGLFLHDGGEGVDGPAAVRLSPDFHADTGAGAWFNWSLPAVNIAALEDSVKNPENHYINLHTVDDPAGAVRAQLAPRVSGVAGIGGVIAANLDKDATTLAPGGLVSIFGTSLAKVATDLRGWTGQRLPTSLNGASVRIGGKPAPLVYVSAGQINAQVPVDVALGAQTLTVDNGNGPSANYPVTIAASAPAIFFSPVPAVLKNANYSLVSAGNPARAGEVILVFATGLGQTSPAVETGELVPATMIANTSRVTATMGGRPATVAYSIASPQFAGLYQVAVTVPSGVSGSVPLLLQQGAATSNTVNIAVQ